MPDIHNIETYIVRYLHQEITEDELLMLDSWLQETPENMEEFIRLKVTHDMIRNYRLMSDEEIDRKWQKMMRKTTDKAISPSTADSPKRKIRQGRLLQYAAAASIAVMISFGAGNYFAKHSRQTAEIRPVTYNEISVPRGGKPNAVHLSDGSIVCLNAATTLRYPSDFEGDMREVYLDGEAHFEVAKNEVKPFIVRLKQQHITVHGTSFNVEAYHNESYTIVTLQEGSVSLESSDKSGLKINHFSLIPGQQAHFDRITGKMLVTHVDTSLSNTWMTGEYKFKNEPLMLIFKRLEKYYDVTFHLEDEKLKSICYTGTFSLRQNIWDVLRIINHESQFRFQQTGNEIHIKSK
jgi:ferric-dicitrate binding protein FerR (iron transport regulator)